MIDLTKPVQTRSGLPARVVSEKGDGAFPILALVEDGGNEFLIRTTHAGSAMLFPGEHPWDLINA
jgi:hypothetical protein